MTKLTTLQSASFEPFTKSAQWYDSFYKDKDYEGEAKKVQNLFASGRGLVELGCGTGRYSIEFERLGYQVHACDLSPQMVQFARDRGVRALVGDLRLLKCWEPLDNVFAGFAVLGYACLTAEETLESFRNIRKNMVIRGGKFVFDAHNSYADIMKGWDRSPSPTDTDPSHVRRTAFRHYDRHKSLLTTIFMYHGEGIEEFQEEHVQRTFVPSEVEVICAATGFRLDEVTTWRDSRNEEPIYLLYAATAI